MKEVPQKPTELPPPYKGWHIDVSIICLAILFIGATITFVLKKWDAQQNSVNIGHVSNSSGVSIVQGDSVIYAGIETTCPKCNHTYTIK